MQEKVKYNTLLRINTKDTQPDKLCQNYSNVKTPTQKDGTGVES